MHKHVFHNDRVLPLDEVRLSPGQAGLLNGWGIFSTVRIYGGVPFGFERHCERLRRDAERIDLPLPYEREAVRKAVSQLLEVNGVRDGFLRVYFVYNRIRLVMETQINPEQVQPALAQVAKSKIRSALGVSEPYSSAIQAGKCVPHPRH